MIQALLAIALFLFSVLAMGQEEAEERPRGLAYEVEVEGVERQLEQRLLAVMLSMELKEHPPATTGLLRRRAQQDLERLNQALRAFGYYASEVELEIDEGDEPIALRYRVNPGEPYLIQEVIVTYEESPLPPEKTPPYKTLGLPQGERFEARMLATAEERLLDWLREQGWPRPAITDRTVRVEHSDHSVHISFVVAPGPVGHFGGIAVSGLNRLEERYIHRQLPWKEGDRFSSKKVEELRGRLTDSNIFSSLIIQTEVAEDSGEVTTKLELEERDPRTVRAGAGFSSDIGLYTKFGWEHRNFAGEGEKLSLSTQIAQYHTSAEAEFRKPMWRSRKQDLLLSLQGAQTDVDPYRSDSLRAAAIVERRLSKQWTTHFGLAMRYAEIVEESGEEEEYALWSIPLQLGYDGSDNLLNPSRGMRAQLMIDPTVDTLQTGVFFQRHRLDWRGYLPVVGQRRLILATRISLGSILWADREQLPADERFYAGGGGSVRGYDYKSLAPHDAEGNNLGGMSLIESSFEVRWRMTERFGLVGFIDGGNAFAEKYPDFGRELQWGGGLGLRYHTGIGPIRLDVGYPLNPEDGASFHVYISIGQSF